MIILLGFHIWPLWFKAAALHFKWILINLLDADTSVNLVCQSCLLCNQLVQLHVRREKSTEVVLFSVTRFAGTCKTISKFLTSCFHYHSPVSSEIAIRNICDP